MFFRKRFVFFVLFFSLVYYLSLSTSVAFFAWFRFHELRFPAPLRWRAVGLGASVPGEVLDDVFQRNRSDEPKSERPAHDTDVVDRGGRRERHPDVSIFLERECRKNDDTRIQRQLCWVPSPERPGQRRIELDTLLE